MPRKILHCLSLALAGASLALGQSAHWDPPGGTLPVGEVSSLQLVFDDCTPDDVPSPPKVDGLRMDFQGQSSAISIINGTYSKNVTLTFAVLASKQADLTIPEFAVKTNKGLIRVPSAHYAPAGATVGSTGVSLGDAAAARMQCVPETVWAGEVFDLKYSIDVADGYYPSWGRGNFEWDPSPLVAEDWSQPEPFTTRGSPPRSGLAYHTRAVAPAPGHIRLNPTSQLINLSVGVSGFGFFQQRQYQQFAVPDSLASIDVRPLPPAPSGFTGAVGDFKIASKIVPRQVKAGEPITWTIELSGSGNWPEIRGLPSREAPRDFQVIQPKPKRTQPAGKLFEGTLSEDVVLVPTRPGTYELPPLEFTYFDPHSGSYKTIEAPGGTVTAEAAGGAAAPADATAAAPGAPQITAQTPTAEAKAPELPSSGLGSPLPPAAPAPAPMRLRTLALIAFCPFVVLAAIWSTLALMSARATDPLRPQREARKRLRATLESLGTAPSSEWTSLLLSWQKDAAVLWGVTHAAPAPSALPDPSWSALWSEADRYLYSSERILPSDWQARAVKALDEKGLKPFSPARLFLPRNLLPFLSLALAAGLLPARADTSSTYLGGEFSAAEKQWRSEVAKDPMNWSARHNLSLALSQQDRWGEATAEAAASFIQNPRDPATARQVQTAGDKAGFLPEPVGALLRQGPVESLARLESPGGWQRVGIGAATLLAASLALILFGAYGIARSRWATPVGAALALIAVLAVVASWVGYRAYGIAADSRAVVIFSAGALRSIPTEADVAQKTTPLAAGSTAIADKTFLRWIRVSFPNGQSGWVLRSEATYLWQCPPN